MSAMNLGGRISAQGGIKMANSGKGIVLILIVLLVVSVALGGWLFYNLDREKTINLTLEEQVNTLNIEKKKVEAKLDEYQRVNSDLQVKLSDVQRKASELTSSLEQEKSLRENALKDRDKLISDIDDLAKQKQLLEKKFKFAQDNIKQLNEKVIELNKSLKQGGQTEDKPSQDKNVELGKIVVSPEAQPATAPAPEIKKEPTPPAAAGVLEGKVLVVNKDYNFAVINLGNKDGVNLGDVFSIYRNKQYLGDVKVEKLHEAMSAAGFLAADLKDRVAEGDKVVIKGK